MKDFSERMSYIFKSLGKSEPEETHDAKIILNDIKTACKRTVSKKHTSIIKSFGPVEYYLGIHKSLNRKSNSASGEGFFYDSQKEITEKWLKYFDDITDEMYDFICRYLGLPKANVVTKSDVVYKGKVLFNPETGKPLKKSDVDNLVKELMKFFNKNIAAGEKLVTEADILGRVLEKLAKNNTISEIRKMKVEAMKYKNVSFQKIVDSETKAAKLFGLDRDVWNKIELMKMSTAQHITGINDKLKNDIQQCLIDGVKDKKSKSQISQDLFNKFGKENRDWKMIADTEIQNNMNNAYIQETVKESSGTKVYFQRMEVLDSRTCDYCRKKNGTVVLFSNNALADDKISDKYASHAIWEGKDWNGTSGNLNSGIFHPNCRGVWVKWDPVTVE